ncbi:hypothetical protein ABB37_02814 [Leptomonas pyrrhocoris]|uniref:Autophagy protein ATG5 UblA domain-containing protein n=1 Tax=Leptomonas pyrrhocoris TaxID=157538 RepID=A0A0N0DXL0_LEPPY|nr:hypothetical protein ABB37_02814 [Leptomonas pyrrhocoris]KPA83108.1 hypothetical protein ABB37_02814 [Leptomonas pyrrhocoris]|eukprot:XP_015661547.1 hypothetical protein ABB37_02814 [Leptomonas pyrrhocoris]
MRSDSEYAGGIPVVVSLAEEDVLHPTERPAPAAFVLPRTTMLIAVVRDLLQLFRPYAAALHPENTQVWFSVGNSPISWLYPAGVIKDYVNECTREVRLEQYAATMTSPTSDHAAAAAVPPTASPPTSSSTLVQSLPLSVPSEPLDLTFHIHSITKGSVRAGTVPLYVNYDRLDEHIRMEIKQSHKAAYTCLYGNYTHYQREAESTLLPAIGLALYRPFDEVAQQQLQAQRLQGQAASRGGGADGRGVASRGRYAGAATDFSSPFLLLQYQQLLQGVLAPRPHVAFLFRVGVPHAYRGATSQFERGHLQYDGYRVSAAPALAWPSSPTSPRTSLPEGALPAADTTVQTPNDQPQADFSAPLVEAEQLPFGLLLWRLFRIPVLRWKAQQTHLSGSSADAVAQTETQRTYQQLLRSLTAYYADPPACATERLEEQEPLLTGTPAEPLAWAAWESARSRALVRDYERGNTSEKLGLPFLESTGNVRAPAAPQRRIRFLVQGIQPSLATPGSFLEAHLSSSDRAIFVTVQVQ